MGGAVKVVPDNQRARSDLRWIGIERQHAPLSQNSRRPVTTGEDTGVGVPIMPPSFRYPSPPQPHAVQTSTVPMTRGVRTS